MATPFQRPRRANANRHPADILLKDKQTRRPSAVVNQEKAAVEAQRQTLLEEREAGLQRIAELEQQLQEQEKRDSEYVARPPSTPSASASKSSETVSRKPAGPAARKVAAAHPSPVTGSGSLAKGTTTSAATPSSGQGMKDDTPQAQTHASGRTKRATRMDIESRRGDNVVAKEAAEVNKQAVKPSARPSKRKSDVAEEGLRRNEKPPKKGKLAKPGGVTAAAAAKFSKPSQAGTVASSVPTYLAGPPVSTPTSKGKKSSKPSIGASTAAVNTLVPTQSVTQEGVAVQYGGYIPDDDEECEDMSSPDMVAIVGPPSTVQSLVKVEIADPAAVPQPPRSTAAGVPVASKSTANWATSDVEQILGAFAGNYTALFVPRFINLTGNCANGPWKLYGLDLQGAMKDIADVVWPQLDVNIVPRQPFFEVSKQKLSEYRNGMGKEAISVVSEYLLSARFETSEDRASYVVWALDSSKYPFRYIRVLREDNSTLKYLGLYQGTLVIRTFAYHMQRIKMRPEQIHDWPCNALALAATAVERALKMWSSGSFIKPKAHTEESKFSDRLWGRSANGYMGSITNLDEEQWDAVLEKADLCARGIFTDSDDESDEDSGNYIPNEIPTTGGRANMDDHWRTEREAYLKGSNIDEDVSMDVEQSE